MEKSEIDSLLGRYEQELYYFALTRDDLGPLITETLALTGHFFEHRDDPAARDAARAARDRYVERRDSLRPLIEEWESVRGSGAKLWEAEPAMSEDQYAHFQSLLAREVRIARDHGEFDQLNEKVRTNLLLFEELTD